MHAWTIHTGDWNLLKKCILYANADTYVVGLQLCHIFNTIVHIVLLNKNFKNSLIKRDYYKFCDLNTK